MHFIPGITMALTKYKEKRNFKKVRNLQVARLKYKNCAL